MKSTKILSNRFFLAGLLLLSCSQLLAQEKQNFLEPAEAVRLAMKQNLGVLISNQNQEIARRNYNWGNAGFLPTVSAAAGKSWSVTNENLEINTGETSIPINRRGARSNNFNAGVTANWVIFDGLGMFRAYDRLRLQYEASNVLNSQTINALAADVLTLYYQHTLQQQRVALWLTTLEVSEQRLRLAKDRFEVGKTSKQDYLAALVDYNADKAALLAQQEALQNTRHQLNRLLGQQPMQPIETLDTLQADASIKQALLTAQPIRNNPQLLASQLQMDIADQWLQEQEAAYWPTLRLNLGYNFTSLNNQVGNLLFRQSQGLVYGLSANWLIFDGFANRRNVQIARIQSKIADLNRQQLELDLLTTQADALVAYRNQWQQIALETDNLDYARESVLIALDRYRLGVITPLELRAAQQSAQQAALRLLSAVYELKLAEVELMRVSGQLVGAY